MAVAMLLGTTSGVWALDLESDFQDPLVQKVNGRDLTFYDIYGGQKTGRGDLNDQIAFYKQVVTANHNLENWSNLAYHIYKSNNKTYWDHAGNGFDEDFGNNHYVDLIHDFSNSIDKKGSDDDKLATGLRVAKSLEDA